MRLVSTVYYYCYIYFNVRAVAFVTNVDNTTLFRTHFTCSSLWKTRFRLPDPPSARVWIRSIKLCMRTCRLKREKMSNRNYIRYIIIAIIRAEPYTELANFFRRAPCAFGLAESCVHDGWPDVVLAFSHTITNALSISICKPRNVFTLWLTRTIASGDKDQRMADAMRKSMFIS